MRRSALLLAAVAFVTLAFGGASPASAQRPEGAPNGTDTPWEVEAWCGEPANSSAEGCSPQQQRNFWRSWCEVGQRMSQNRCARHFQRLQGENNSGSTEAGQRTEPITTSPPPVTPLQPELTPEQVRQAEAERATDAERRAREAAEARAREAERRLETAQQRADREARERAEAQARAADLETQRAALEGEKTELSQNLEQQQTQFQELWTRNRQTIIIGVAVATSLALIAVLAWWLFFRKAGELSETDRRLQSETRRARELRSRVPPDPVDNWVLEGEESSRGLRIKLPGAKLPEGAGGVRIGRSPEHADAVLAKPEISRAHARFFARGADLYAEDLGSKNGTAVRDETLTRGDRKLVYDGDMIDLGPYRFRLVKVA